MCNKTNAKEMNWIAAAGRLGRIAVAVMGGRMAKIHSLLMNDDGRRTTTCVCVLCDGDGVVNVVWWNESLLEIRIFDRRLSSQRDSG